MTRLRGDEMAMPARAVREIAARARQGSTWVERNGARLLEVIRIILQHGSSGATSLRC
jgi:hypothetical protein